VTEEEALAHANAVAEAELAKLEADHALVTAARSALTAGARAEALAQRDAAAREVTEATLAAARLRAERDRLLEQSQTQQRALLPVWLTGPLGWALRMALLTFYVVAVFGAYQHLRSPALTLALLFGAPIAFVVLLVAGSLRESRIESPAGGQSPTPEGAPQLPGDDGSLDATARRPDDARVPAGGTGSADGAREDGP
jgi:hypothetical protein